MAENTTETPPPTEPAPECILELSDVVHQKARLAIMVALDEAGFADFSYLKGALSMTDGNLGRHLEVLAKGGLVDIEKSFQSRRPRTQVRLTEAGKRELSREMTVLALFVQRYQQGSA
ncbi:MAG TPA: transcriptional regulator [Mycobacteriales bacterium]|jgi:DNA-binding HxlR family transcriptional regulator|nr:transcriptional regulator [Mycobacteriales bacterium]